jgi:hypothetical protein
VPRRGILKLFQTARKSGYKLALLFGCGLATIRCPGVCAEGHTPRDKSFVTGLHLDVKIMLTKDCRTEQGNGLMNGMLAACLGAVTVLAAGCYTPPPMAVQSPPPAVVPVPPPTGYPVYTPDYYVWDGDEYVGVSGGQYVYWSGGAWIAADPIILGRFHGWERGHPEWRRHSVRYRRGHEPHR